MESAKEQKLAPAVYQIIGRDVWLYRIFRLYLDPCSRAMLRRTCRYFREFTPFDGDNNKAEAIFTQTRLVDIVCAYGSGHLMYWCKDKGLDLRWYESMTEQAVIAGNLSVLKWMRDYYPLIPKDLEQHLWSVVRHGHLHVVEWIFSDVLGRKDLKRLSSDIMWTAACQGHLHILQWLSQSGVCLDPWLLDRVEWTPHAVAILDWLYGAGHYYLCSVKFLTGKRLEIEASKNTTVSQLKDSVCERSGLPPDLQVLVFNGKQLKEGTCEDYGIRPRSQLHLIPLL